MPRLVPGWPRLLLLALPVPIAAAVLLGAFYFARSATAAPAPPPVALAPALPAAVGLLVHVSGAVVRPGLYRMQRGDRVYAAIAAAGGLAPAADQAKLPDLAGRLKDGEQVKVPFLKGATAAGVVSARVDVNSATADELAAVPGFTLELAAALVAYRQQYGPLASLTDLETALGMSKYDYALARKYLAVG